LSKSGTRQTDRQTDGVKHYRPDKCTLAAMASAAQQQRALAAGASRCSPSLHQCRQRRYLNTIIKKCKILVREKPQSIKWHKLRPRVLGPYL